MRSAKLRAERVSDGPIIHPGLSASIGQNIQGPSLIRAPDWIKTKLGNYYLYFADHKGQYIRLAYANDLTGPWLIYEPGSLQLKDSHFLTETPPTDETKLSRIRHQLADVPYPHDVLHDLNIPHIASPDVHVDEENQQIRMYYHGLDSFGLQLTRVALSEDGINFTASPEPLAQPYLRMFQHKGWHYGLAMPGQFYRSKTGVNGFEKGPRLFTPRMRHSAVMKRQHTLHVFWTDVGDTPERILHTTVDLSRDWQNWRTTEHRELLRPVFAYEGADAPLEPSMRSVAYGHVNQLRDPAIYIEQDKAYLLYSVAGESGIAIAEILPD